MVSAVKKPKPKKGESSIPEREVLYPDLVSELFIGDDALTVQQARDFLLWQEVTEENKGDKNAPEPLFKDRELVPIRCLNNLRNRPFYQSNCEEIVQEILNGRWQFNGEPIIIGRTGVVLNGQHQLAALVLAEQDRVKDPKKWAHVWKGPCTIDKLVVKGIREDDAVINTMDTCKPRSLADVIYRSEFFSKMTSDDRRVISRVLDNAIRLVWDRTWAKDNAYAPRRNHSEALDFVQRHQRILQAAKHVFEEDQQEAIRGVYPPGMAAGMLYLMGAGASDGGRYYDLVRGGDANEKKLDFSMWEKAEEFWTLLGARSPKLAEIREKFIRMANAGDGTAPPVPARTAVIVRGWLAFSEKGEVTEDDLDISDCYEEDKDAPEILTLEHHPKVGGIDRGKKEKVVIDDTMEDDAIEGDEEALEANKEEVRREKGHIPVDNGEEGEDPREAELRARALADENREAEREKKGRGKKRKNGGHASATVPAGEEASDEVLPPD
jgi:hypothetical protein